jgi:nicotinate-nucleotide adenylyltransferase
VGPQHPASVGILGGTFNPPHLGHLALARHALAALALQRVVLMPAHTSPRKPVAPDPGPEHRLRMCRLLVRDTPGVSVCALEIERGGRSYTVDTLTAIHASHPHAELTFIVGADTVSTLPGWREPARLLRLADLAVAARAGTTRAEVLASLRSVGDGRAGAAMQAHDRAGADGRTGAQRVRFLQMPVIDVSSSAARRRAADGRAIEDLVGPDVASYVSEQGLYRAPPGAAS